MSTVPTPSFPDDPSLREELRRLQASYFSDPTRRRILKKGETLLHQREANHRLYLILTGTISARIEGSDGQEHELFKALPNMFVGVYSVFSRTYTSLTHLIAEEDATLAYLESEDLEAEQDGDSPLYERFMPVIVAELIHRHQRTRDLVMERERALEKLIEHAKMVSLGQMAAGLAHELNNAIAVLERNTDWLSTHILTMLSGEQRPYGRHYREGLQQGRTLSSRDVRQKSQALQARYQCNSDIARKIAEAGLSEDLLATDTPALEEQVRARHQYWEMGAAFHDMRLAARHAAHVVASMKTLGARQEPRRSDVDVNESLQEAVALLRSPLRRVTIRLSLAPLPPLHANKGELVQIWTNLIKNACESMQQAGTPEPALHLRSTSDGAFIRVQVQDNGPGIPPDLLPRIFQPDVTTKVDGLSFGLGLGLTIVERLVNAYRGTISVESLPGRTLFTVALPIPPSYAKREHPLHR